MNDASGDTDRLRRVGLCVRCQHTDRVVSSRGSEFWLCRRSRQEPTRFPKYPRLPVLRCAGFEVTADHA